MSFSSPSKNSRWISTLPLLLAPLVAAAPLPNEPTASTLTSSSTPYPMITNMGTAAYTYSPPSTITAAPTATLNSFDSLSDMDWNSYPTLLPTEVDEPSMVPVIVQPGDTSNDAYALSPTPTASWVLPPKFSDMSSFQVTTYAAGKHNMAILEGSPARSPSNGTTSESDGSTETTPTTTSGELWDTTRNALQILYPSGSVNPGNSPQGGSEFYANPLDITQANNASLEYSVYFPPDFDFVKGGKLPGLYGGHKGCSGGNAAEDCFSTRLMWRSGGQGELYLYAPKDKQTPELCQTPPLSKCDAAYGLSIGRGSWKFALGDWTKIRQDVWLNTPGKNDGGFNIWINDKLILNSNQVRYRENGNTCLRGQDSSEAGGDDVSGAMINTIGFGDSDPSDSSINETSSKLPKILNEDWQASEKQIISTSTSIISTITVTSTLPPIEAYSTPYSYIPASSPSPSSTSASSASAVTSFTSVNPYTSSATPSSASSSSASSSTSLQKRDGEPTLTSSSSQSDPSATQHALVITIPITDSITTVTATAAPTTTTETATAFITIPTTMIATNTITDSVQVTITPSASALTDTVTNTVYVTETGTPKIVAIETVTATVDPAEPTQTQTPGGMELSNKSILINKEQEQPIISSQQQPQSDHKLQPIILKSPSTNKMPTNQTINDIQSQSQSCDGSGGVGFIGLFFSTFFGGHDQDWASPKDQYTYFREFKMWVNN